MARREPKSLGRVFLLATLVTGAAATVAIYVSGESEMQHEFDRQRLLRQRELAARIVRFREQEGRCPLGREADDRHVAVLLAHEPATLDEPRAPRVLPATALARELARVEQVETPLPIDPEMHGWVYRPAIRYETDGRAFAIGVSLHHPHPGAIRISWRWHRFTLVGSCRPGSGPPVPSRSEGPIPRGPVRIALAGKIAKRQLRSTREGYRVASPGAFLVRERAI